MPSDAAVASATAYVRTRFFPPLPHAYGRLAVRAVDYVNAGEPDRKLSVRGLPVQPRGTVAGLVTARRLVEALRVDHLIDDDGDDDLL